MRAGPPYHAGVHERPAGSTSWCGLDDAVKLAHLTAARDRHVARARAGRPDEPAPGAVHVIDGRDFDDLLGFFCAMGEAINGPGGYFGLSLRAFDDCLFGGFGLIGPCTLRWRHVARSREHLGAAALIAHYEPMLAEIPAGPEFDEGREAIGAALARARRGEWTLFDEVLETITSVAQRHLAHPAWVITVVLEA